MTRRTGVALALVAGIFSSQAAAIAVELPISARAAIVVDAQSGQVLYDRDADLALPPASTTKVLTAIVALESGRLDDTLEVSPYAASTPPCKIGMQAGSRARLQDLLYAVLLKSANDAAEVVAEGVGGSQEGFAALMNAKARRIGATNSHFVNPHGLTDDGHVSSARDLARIFRYGLNIPTFRDILSTRAIDFPIENDGIKMVTVRSHNRLLNGYTYPVIGKTGYTQPAKRCFVGAATSGDREVIIALLGSRDLWGDARKLVEFGIEGKTDFGDMPPLMMARDRDDDGGEEYERLASAHQRRSRRGGSAVAAREPVRYVRRWVKTKVHGRVIRTLVAQPVHDGGHGATRMAATTRAGRLAAERAAAMTRAGRQAADRTAVASRGGKSAKAQRTAVARAPERGGTAAKTKATAQARTGRNATAAVATATKGKTVAGAKTVKVPVGKIAASKARGTTAKADTKAAETGKGKAAPGRSGATRPQTKVRISGQRPSVVARR